VDGVNIEPINEVISGDDCVLSTTKWSFKTRGLEPGERLREAELTGVKNLLRVLLVREKSATRPDPKDDVIEESLTDRRLMLTTSRWSLEVAIGEGERIHPDALSDLKTKLANLVEPTPAPPEQAWADRVRVCPATAYAPFPFSETPAGGSRPSTASA
jgi:hypothetical protein